MLPMRLGAMTGAPTPAKTTFGICLPRLGTSSVSHRRAMPTVLSLGEDRGWSRQKTNDLRCHILRSVSRHPPAERGHRTRASRIAPNALYGLLVASACDQVVFWGNPTVRRCFTEARFCVLPLCSGKTRTGNSQYHVLRPTSPTGRRDRMGGRETPNRVAPSIRLQSSEGF